jgi:Neuraminidase (sialidase)
MAEDPEYRRNFEEPSLTRLRNGKMISMIRITTGVSPLWPASNEGYLWQTESTDDGHTWSKPFKTNIWGHPAEIVELKDGRLLCVYGYRRAPFGVRASLSKDGGKTWDVANEIVLRSDGGSGDLGYPSSVQFEDGRVLTVYWINHEKNGDPQSEARYVAGTIYKP